ncbi:MAG: hypothetical protein E5W39_15495, partial [Mesorhizobium sp.]
STQLSATDLESVFNPGQGYYDWMYRGGGFNQSRGCHDYTRCRLGREYPRADQ